jgi:branched-chain amino acid transport system permease protein
MDARVISAFTRVFAALLPAHDASWENAAVETAEPQLRSAGTSVMIYLQIAANGLVLGGLYACIAVGFSLVWGVLNVINILHGTFIVLGSYIAYFAYVHAGIHPFISVIIAGGMLYALGHAIHAGIINRVIAAPVLITLTLTFGLDLILNNAMLVAFTANYRSINLARPLGTLEIGPVFLPGDRVAAMALALLLTVLLWRLLRDSRIGRAIVAVRMDREAAALMGVDVKRINAITFGIGALMAGAAGALLSIIFPISPLNSGSFLGKAFVVCVLGGLGSVPGAIVGGIVLGIIESFGAYWFGPEHAVTISFAILLLLLFARPRGLVGRRGYE